MKASEALERRKAGIHAVIDRSKVPLLRAIAATGLLAGCSSPPSLVGGAAAAPMAALAPHPVACEGLTGGKQGSSVAQVPVVSLIT